MPMDEGFAHAPFSWSVMCSRVLAFRFPTVILHDTGAGIRAQEYCSTGGDETF